MDKVTKADRDAGNKLLRLIDCMGSEEDCWHIDRAFARHRLAALEEAAKVAYRTCAETRHVTLGDSVEAAIRALAANP